MLKRPAAIIKTIVRSRLFKCGVLFAILVAIAVTASSMWIANTNRDMLYSNVDEVPYNNVGLVLGANKRSGHGSVNLYFANRIEAAVQLFEAGKIRHILVSGDNHISEYDEATDMKNALVAMGVPDSCITLDYAGFRTLDSVVRCRKIFGQDKVTVISQKFHNQRALFIARYYGLEAVGFNAKDVPAKYSIRTSLREHFARFKAVLDLYILKTAPRFLGPEEKISL